MSEQDRTADNNRLGAFLRKAREKLDYAALGLPAARRRTPGLRREEVAQRAHISTTWYAWLEQGRGGAPSVETLERISRALMLSENEREHLFLLGLGHPPEARYQEEEGVAPRLQKILDALEPCPALIRTATWDVIGWNRGAAALFVDYGSFAPGRRNILRFFFLDPRARASQYDWLSVARFLVGAFRLDTARAGAAAAAAPLIEDLCRDSAEFAALWREEALGAQAPDPVKRLRHPELGEICVEISSFAIDGRSDRMLIAYHPYAASDAEKLAALVSARRPGAAGPAPAP